ncbi:LamG domain-containing protein [Kovacikia minuta CCNUW1]|uniref:LamG domain-containing protein n=1 Tax=Kovacikia minuta TaxID=2931930 RepID=UPI001CCDB59F|nr:LamG domain-containing protein [Kovacikia minuta]UBF28322.1 LamG domain-containing protein [Kovacikia minuta CCNUW1]
MSTTGLKVYWRADECQTNGSGIVTQLTDISGQGFHASGTGGPAKISDALNGVPVLRFTGNQFLSHSYLGEIATVIALVRPEGVGAYRALLSARGATRDAYWFGTTSPGGNAIFQRNDASGNDAYIRYLQEPFKWNVWTGRVQASSLDFFFNSYKGGSLALSSRLPITGDAYLGAASNGSLLSDFWMGDLAELAIFDQPLASAEIGKIVSYLKGFYVL